MTKLFTVFFSLLTGFAMAQAAGNVRALNTRNSDSPALFSSEIHSDTSMTLAVNILYNIPASKYVAVFALAQPASTLDLALRFAFERVMGFKRELARVLDTTAIHLDIISILPVYELEAEKKLFSRRFVETPTGFEVKQNLHIPIQAESQLPTLVAIAAKHEIYDFVQLEYFLEQPNLIYDSLRAVAIAELQKKMKNYVVLGYQLLPEAQTLAEKIEILAPRYNSYTPQSSVRLPSAKITEARKSPTVFYAPLLNSSQDKVFDKVLGSNPTHPVMQVIFSLKTRIRVKKK